MHPSDPHTEERQWSCPEETCIAINNMSMQAYEIKWVQDSLLHPMALAG
jgi:hypothetical protein